MTRIEAKKKIQYARSLVHNFKIMIDIWDEDMDKKRVKYNVPYKIYVPENTKKRVLRKYNFKKSKYKNIDRENLLVVEFDSYYKMTLSQRIMKANDVDAIYPTDFVYEYMVYNDIICNDYLEKRCSLDIEVDPNGMDLKNIEYEQPIVAAAIVGCDGKEFIYSAKVNNDLSVDKEEEIKLIKKIYASLVRYRCILGWNVKEFDIAYLKERCMRLGLDYNFDIFQIFDLMEKYKLFLKRDREPGEVVSYKLNSAAWRMLGKKKVDINIHKYMELLRDNPEKAEKYVLEDARLVEDLYNVKGIGSLCRIDEVLAKKLYVFPETNHPTRLFEVYLDKKAREKNILLPNNWKHYQGKDEVEGKGEGGYVIEPKKGLYKNCYAADYTSLYPSIIRTHNIGIDSAVWDDKSGKNIIETEDISFRKDFRSLNAEIMDELFETRLEYREKLNDPNLTKEERRWYGTMSDAYKLLLVSANGILDNPYFKYRNRHLYDATTKTGQWYTKAIKKIVEKLGNTVYYGDSVMPNTPVTIKRNGRIHVIPIEDLHWAKSRRRSTRELKEDIEVWTEKGWSKIKYTYSHKVNKKGYKIMTDKGFVEVTEDHSIVVDGEEVSPKDLSVGDEIELYRPRLKNGEKTNPELAWLMGLYVADGTRGIYETKYGTKRQCRIANQDVELLKEGKKILESIGIKSKIIYASDGMRYLGPYDTGWDKVMSMFKTCHSKQSNRKIVPWFILNGTEDGMRSFFDGYLAGDGYINKHGAVSFCSKDNSLIEGMCLILDKLGYDYYISRRKDKENIVKVRIRKTKARNRKAGEIITIEEFEIDDYVYDIETENHHFCGGIGGILLHNTDSIYVSLPYGDNYEKAVMNFPKIEEKWNRILKKLAVKKFNLDPEHYYIDIRFETICSKIFFSTKKQYIGKLVWKNYKWLDERAGDNVSLVKGLLLKKYNTLELVKEVMQTIFDIVLSDVESEKEMMEKAILELEKLKADLYAGNRDDLLVKSQQVHKLTGYKSNPPHLRAARKLDEMGKFEPGMIVEYIKKKNGDIVLYGKEDFIISKETYDYYWRNHAGKWVKKILGKKVAGYPSLDFGYSRPTTSLVGD